MSKILPTKDEVKITLSGSTVVNLDSDRGEVILDALSSRTTREIFMEIYENETTISEISDEFDSSLQNIKYHVEKLEEAGLVESVATNYSEKGNEMDVYAPTNESIILVASRLEKYDSLQKAIKSIGLVTIFATLISFGFSQFVDNINEEKTVTYEYQPQRAEKSPGIDTSEKTGTTRRITETVSSVAEEISIGFIKVSPDIAVPIIFLFGVIFGCLCYVFFSRV